MTYNKREKAAIIIFIGLLAVFHLAMVPGTRDDLWFSKALDSYWPFEYLAMRYETWTARLIPELLLIFFSRHLILWRIANIIICSLLVYGILRLSGLKNLIAGLICVSVFPLWYMSETGWCTTFMCYIWPLAAGLLSLCVLKAVYQGDRVLPFKQVIAAVLLLYAVSSEQIAVVFFCIFAFSFVAGVIKDNRKLRVLSGIFALETAGMMAFSLTCPGNAARVVAETNAHMPEFPGLNVFNKLVLGVNTTFSEIAMGDLVPFFFFGVLILTALYSKKKPGVILGLLGMVYYVLVYATNLLNIEGLIPAGLENAYAYGFFCLNVCFALAVVTALTFTSGDLWQGMFLTLIYGSGFLSRVMMGFSPTCFESGQRTFTLYDISLIMCGLILLGNTCAFAKPENGQAGRWYQRVLYAGISVLALAETAYLTLFLGR